MTKTIYEQLAFDFENGTLKELNAKLQDARNVQTRGMAIKTPYGKDANTSEADSAER